MLHLRRKSSQLQHILYVALGFDLEKQNKWGGGTKKKKKVVVKEVVNIKGLPWMGFRHLGIYGSYHLPLSFSPTVVGEKNDCCLCFKKNT